MRFSALFTDYNLLRNDKRKTFFRCFAKQNASAPKVSVRILVGTNDIGGFRGHFQSLSRQLFGEPGESRLSGGGSGFAYCRLADL